MKEVVALMDGEVKRKRGMERKQEKQERQEEPSSPFYIGLGYLAVAG